MIYTQEGNLGNTGDTHHHQAAKQIPIQRQQTTTNLRQLGTFVKFVKLIHPSDDRERATVDNVHRPSYLQTQLN